MLKRLLPIGVLFLSSPAYAQTTNEFDGSDALVTIGPVRVSVRLSADTHALNVTIENRSKKSIEAGWAPFGEDKLIPYSNDQRLATDVLFIQPALNEKRTRIGPDGSLSGTIRFPELIETGVTPSHWCYAGYFQVDGHTEYLELCTKLARQS